MAVLSSGVALASDDSFAPILQSERAESSLCGADWWVSGKYAARAASWDPRGQLFRRLDKLGQQSVLSKRGPSSGASECNTLGGSALFCGSVGDTRAWTPLAAAASLKLHPRRHRALLRFVAITRAWLLRLHCYTQPQRRRGSEGRTKWRSSPSPPSARRSVKQR